MIDCRKINPWPKNSDEYKSEEELITVIENNLNLLGITRMKQLIDSIWADELNHQT